MSKCIYYFFIIKKKQKLKTTIKLTYIDKLYTEQESFPAVSHFELCPESRPDWQGAPVSVDSCHWTEPTGWQLGDPWACTVAGVGRMAGRGGATYIVRGSDPLVLGIRGSRGWDGVTRISRTSQVMRGGIWDLVGTAVAAGWRAVWGRWAGWVPAADAAGLFVLSHLDGLADAFEVDADHAAAARDSVGRGRDAVRGRGSAVGRGRSAAVAAAVSATESGPRLGFFPKEDLADLLEDLRVDLLSLGGLIAGGDGAEGATADAAAEAAAESATAAVTAGGTVVVVAWRSLGAATRHQSQGYALRTTGDRTD